MASEIQYRRLILEIQNHVPGVMGVGSPLWASTNIDHRRQIRESIQTTLSLPPLTETPPRPADWSVSISHSRSFGGWIAVPRPARIGFDVEDSERIQSRIVQRVSMRQEIASAPDPAFLWCAKEAVYKSLEHEQPDVMTSITIGDWQTLGGDSYSFTSPYSIGWIVVSGSSLLSASLVVSN